MGGAFASHNSSKRSFEMYVADRFRDDLSRVDTHRFGEDIVVQVIDWIESNLEPLQIFSEETLFTFIREEYKPEDIFKEDQLMIWADSKGLI